MEREWEEGYEGSTVCGPFRRYRQQHRVAQEQSPHLHGVGLSPRVEASSRSDTTGSAGGDTSGPDTGHWREVPKGLQTPLVPRRQKAAALKS